MILNLTVKLGTCMINLTEKDPGRESDRERDLEKGTGKETVAGNAEMMTDMHGLYHLYLL